MRRRHVVAAAVLAVAPVTLVSGIAAQAGGPLWSPSVTAVNQVASAPTVGGGYPDPSGQTFPNPGTCGPAQLNSNHSESWLAVKPGGEDIVGVSKFFVDKYSADYNFYLGSYRMPAGRPATDNQVQGYDCVSTGTQAMPPSWTNVTDPNVAFDTRGRAYQTTLPFNAFWGGANLHPDGAINLSYSDDLGQHWTTGNGGQPLESSPNASTNQLGHVEDKQWVAVDSVAGSKYQDHVYAMWSVFNNNTTKIRLAVSRDRGLTFSKPTTITSPSQTGPSNTYIYPSVDAVGDLYVAFTSFPLNANRGPTTVYVGKSTNDGQSFSPFVAATPAIGTIPGCCLTNTTFRDGITENFTASPSYPGHLYLTYEDWDGSQMDVKLSQSLDGGATWTRPAVVNDNVDPTGTVTDQFQPSVAAGPGGAVAVAFYDRRAACPADPSIRPQDVGRTNFCIDVSMQAYRDSGAGAVPVGHNVRMTSYTWDPEQPDQNVGGLPQLPCGDANCAEHFIGDYFGLAISGANVYGLFVSTHYPSGITSDAGGPVYYQQQVLATVPRSKLGL